MALYSYIAKTKDGQEVRSTQNAATRLDALEILRKKGLIVVDLFSVEEQSQNAPKKIILKDTVTPEKKPAASFFSGSSKVKMTELAVFCRQLAIAVNAGLPLRDAIEGIGMELENPVLRRISGDMVRQLHDGRSFSQAVAMHPKVFNSMFQGLIKVAEESGTLPSTLKELASYMERADKLQRRIKSMSTYPMFIGIFFIAVCLIMTLFILPQFSDIFAGQGNELPGITKFVFGLNTFLVDNILLIFVAVVMLVAGISLYRRTPGGSFQWDKLKMNIPYVGGCIKKYVLARFCRSLSIMVHSGVPISSALEICADATGNQLIKRNVLNVRELIMSGNRISASFEQADVFPGLIVRMVSVGEDSGQLPEVLDNVSDLYDDQVEVSIMTTMALFEPLIICVFGVFILMIVMAIYMPIFSVSSGMQ